MTGNTFRVEVVLPNDIDDPATPSGGNIYDRRICRGVAALGWSVCEHPVRGGWPNPSRAERLELARVLSGFPDDAVVLVDGLIGSVVPEVLQPHAERLHLVIMMHMPLGDQAEGQALRHARAVIVTSEWARRRLLGLYRLPAAAVHVAIPGVDPAPVAPGSTAGGNLLCVAAVRPHKGHDVLVSALAQVADLPWRCVCVGPGDSEPAYVDRVRRQIDAAGMTDRIPLVGPRTGDELDASYGAADLLVLAARRESYGMVVGEALARGIPAVLTAAAGLPEALGHRPNGIAPGLLVEPDDPAALARALRRWLTEPDLRAQLRQAARDRRATLGSWADTSQVISAALRGVLAQPRSTT